MQIAAEVAAPRFLFTIGRGGLSIVIPATPVTRVVTAGVTATAAMVCFFGSDPEFGRCFGVWFRKPTDSKKRFIACAWG